MITKPKIIESTLNDIGKKFDYRKKEIPFELFKSFFHHAIFIQTNDGFMGWGEHESDCGTLGVSTASFDGGCFLRHVRHRILQNNPYNNFVNAIAYWGMMNETGKSFFINLYSTEIILLKSGKKSKIYILKEKIKNLEKQIIEIDNEVKQLTSK